MTMMTDAPTRRRGPLLTLSSLEWKLTLTAILSAIYAFSFIAVARPPMSPQATGANAQPPALSVASSVQAARAAPATVAPATVAPATVASATAPRAAQPRIRTRSS
jgi:hypothetical protein